MRWATLVLALALALLSSAGRQAGAERALSAQHSRIHISEDGKPAEPEKNIFKFTISPAQGGTGGGTQVTLTLSEDFPENPSGAFWCKFGEKVVPSESYFLAGDGTTRNVVCQTPSGPPRNYPVRVSLDGKNFHLPAIQR